MNKKDCASLNNWIFFVFFVFALHAQFTNHFVKKFKFPIVISSSKLNLRVFPVAYDLQGCLEIGLTSS